MRTDWNRARFKETGKTIFLANSWPFVGVLVLLLLLSGNAVVYQLNQITNDLIELFWVAGIMEPVPFLQRVEVYTDWVPSLSLGAGFVIALLVAYPYEVGVCRFLLENSAGRAAPFSQVGFGFRANYGNVVLTQFLRALFTALWTLLLIIPGIIRGIGYFAVPYILAENPNLPWRRALQLSLSMTDGYKWRIFVFQLSYLGWYLLDIFTLGILGIFYVSPYYYAAQTEVYRHLRECALAEGIATPEDLPGLPPPIPPERSLP